MLKQLLKAHGITLAELGNGLRQTHGKLKGNAYGKAAMAQWVNHGIWPKATPEKELKGQAEEFLKARGIGHEELKALWAAGATAAPGKSSTRKEDETMLPKKTALSKDAMQHFRLPAIPFGDVTSDSDMYLGGPLRSIREKLMMAMRSGGFVALVGESGAGKTTLMEECEEQIARNQEGVILIRPPIVGMDTDASKGSPLKARSILQHIMDVVAPNAKRPVELPRFTASVQRELAARAGQRFCLVIDDAHRLHPSTLCHLKDFYELKLGRNRLLGIVLLGQPHLARRLDPANYDMIQISQRCEIIPLPPLAEDIGDYLKARLAAVGADAGAVFDEEAYPALRQRLSASPLQGGRKQGLVNLAYPLAVNNLAILAMNEAAKVKEKLVTAEVVREA